MHLAGQPETLCRQNADSLSAILNGDGPTDPQIPALPAVVPDTRVLDQPDERLPAAVQDRHLEIIDLHKDVVDPHRVENAQQMFGSRDQHAVPHQAGRIADSRYMPPTRRDLKVLEVGPDKHDAGGNGRGQNADANRNAAVESHPRTMSDAAIIWLMDEIRGDASRANANGAGSRRR